MKSAKSATERSNSDAADRKGVQSVDRAFDLLRIFERSDRALGVKEIAQAAEMTPSQVHHYLVSLTRSGALQQRPEGTYELGVFTLQLGLSALRHLDPVERAVQAAREFRDANGEATFIALWGSHGATIIRYFEGFQPVTVEIRAGLTMPLLGSATGHIFLTWLSDGITSSVMPEHSDFDPEMIKAQTRKAGLGQVHGVLLPRIAALAAPVFDSDGRLAFSITTLGWIGAFDDALDGPVASELLSASRKLSASLGHTN